MAGARGIACQDWLTVRLVSAMRHQQCLPLPSGPHCPARCVENHVPFICVPHRVRAATSPQLIISRRGAETTQRWPPSPAPTNTTGEAGSQRAVCGGSSNSSGLVQLQRVARAVPRRPGPRCTASTRCSRPPRGSSCRSPASWCSWPQPAPARAPRSARSAGRPASAHPRCLAAGSPVRLNLSGQEPRRHAGKSQSKPPPTSTQRPPHRSALGRRPAPPPRSCSRCGGTPAEPPPGRCSRRRRWPARAMRRSSRSSHGWRCRRARWRRRCTPRHCRPSRGAGRCSPPPLRGRGLTARRRHGH
jgi:hypothetical protein